VNGKLRNKPFHTLHVSTENERGLGGIAVDPDYATNRFIYVYYTTAPGAKRYAGTPENRVARLKQGKNGMVKEKIILDHIPALTNIHNGGDLQFGFDGKLYVSVGENGCCANEAKELDTLLGKILRINKDGTIPPDNPFYNVPGARQETYAFGFRNPWRLTPRASNQSFIVADVGEGTWEEIDSLQPGGFYGWPIYEGPCPVVEPECDAQAAVHTGSIKPIYWYHHGKGVEQGDVIAGGVFAENSNYPPPYAEAYFYADGFGGWVHVLTLDASNQVLEHSVFDTGLNFPVSFGRGPDGNVYVVGFGGVIYKYVYAE
jgi:glucose/arabinose dehydrogenase